MCAVAFQDFLNRDKDVCYIKYVLLCVEIK